MMDVAPTTAAGVGMTPSLKIGIITFTDLHLNLCMKYEAFDYET